MKTRLIGFITAAVMLFVLIAPVNAAAFEEKGNPFSDVRNSMYYHDAVLWAYSENITQGTSDTTFSPNETCTRGQVVTFLWRALGGRQANVTENHFVDVEENQYYYSAVMWAIESGITIGTSETRFSPNETCTTAQVLTFLWRSCGKPAAIGESSLAAKNAGQYYTEAVAWAECCGILNNTLVRFDPLKKSPRSEIVTFLYNNAGSPEINDNQTDVFYEIGKLVKEKGSFDMSTSMYLFEYKSVEESRYSIRYYDGAEPIIGLSYDVEVDTVPVSAYMFIKKFSNSEIACLYGVELPSYGASATGKVYDRAVLSADTDLLFETYSGPDDAAFKEPFKEIVSASLEDLLVNTELLSFISLAGFNSDITIRDLGFESAYKKAWNIR